MKAGNAGRKGWMLRWGGADVKVYASQSAWAPPRWKLSLFEAPPVESEFWFDERRADWPMWPMPAAHAAARSALLTGQDVFVSISFRAPSAAAAACK